MGTTAANRINRTARARQVHVEDTLPGRNSYPRFLDFFAHVIWVIIIVIRPHTHAADKITAHHKEAAQNTEANQTSWILETTQSKLRKQETDHAKKHKTELKVS
jgi:23S rRNA maturation mini-RNase III